MMMIPSDPHGNQVLRPRHVEFPFVLLRTPAAEEGGEGLIQFRRRGFSQLRGARTRVFALHACASLNRILPARRGGRTPRASAG